MKQEHESIEELLAIEKDLKKILDGGCYLEYFEGVTRDELLYKSYEIKVATNPLRELAKYVVNYEPHLNSRNLLERFVRWLRDKDLGIHKNHSLLQATEVGKMEVLVDEFIESEL